MNPPSTTITVLVTACLSAGVMALLLIEPAVSRSQAATAKQVKVTADNDQKRSQDQAAAKQAAQLALLRPQVLDLLPASDLQYDLVVQVEGLARTLAVPLTALTITGSSAPAAGAPAATDLPAGAATPLGVALSVSVTGTYPQIRQFVQALPTVSRSVAITQLSVSTATATQKDASSSSNIVTVSITASAYYQLPTTKKKS